MHNYIDNLEPDQYIYWQCWNPIPIGNVRILFQYIDWQCWNPVPMHILTIWNPIPVHLLVMLEPYSNTSVRTLPMHVLTVLEPYSSIYIYWQCWNPIPVHRLAMLEPCPNAYIAHGKNTAGLQGYLCTPLTSVGHSGALWVSLSFFHCNRAITELYSNSTGSNSML